MYKLYYDFCDDFKRWYLHLRMDRISHAVQVSQLPVLSLYALRLGLNLGLSQARLHKEKG